jgi:excisionase family DNA binding protein
MKISNESNGDQLLSPEALTTHDPRTEARIAADRGSTRGLIPAESYVDAAEAGRFLSLHPRTVQRPAREGRLPAHPLGEGARKTWRFLLSELDEWMRSRVHSSSHPCRSKGEATL